MSNCGDSRVSRLRHGEEYVHRILQLDDNTVAGFPSCPKYPLADCAEVWVCWTQIRAEFGGGKCPGTCLARFKLTYNFDN